MYFFYTLIVSGLLILSEVPAGLASPSNVNYPTQHNVVSLPQQSLGAPTNLSSAPIVQIGLGSQQPLAAEVVLAPMNVKASETKATATALAVAPQATPVPTLPPKAVSDSAVLATYQQQSALPVSGYAMYYNPNIMQEVLRYRLELGQVTECKECVGNVALLRAGDLNRRVWLQWEDGVVEGPYLVVDVAAKHHIAQLLNRNWVVDVDNRTAMRRGMAGPVMVTVWGAPPAGQPSTPPFAPLYSAMPVENKTIPGATPYTVLEVVSNGVPPHTPTVTPLPIISATPTAQSVVVQGGFPTDTPVPTVTPLPVIEPSLAMTAPVVHQGFPTDTPVPTITPLPIIEDTPTPAQVVPPTATLTPTATATSADMPAGEVVIPQGFPTETPIPTITPLPVITPLPAASPTGNN